MPPVSKFTESERQKRKREAARLRQQRCRARKRERNRKNSFVTVDTVKKRRRCDSFAATSKQGLATEMAEDSNSTSASSSWDLLLKPTMFRGETQPSPKVTHSNAPASYPVHSISPCSTLNFPLYDGETSDANRSINTIHINKSNKNKSKLPLVPSLSALEPKSMGIDEHERTAINIIMSLRHSPVFHLSVNPRFTSSSNYQVSK